MNAIQLKRGGEEDIFPSLKQKYLEGDRKFRGVPTFSEFVRYIVAGYEGNLR